MKKLMDLEIKNHYSEEKWRNMSCEKRMGVLVPLFSIYSTRSMGSGDFEDLKLIVDWCERTSNKILQLMPLNDFHNSPYAPFSFFALDPVYIALDKLIGVPEDLVRDGIEEIKRNFPTGRGYIDYEVKHAKINLLYKVYKQIDLMELECSEFKKFIEENKYWIEYYCLYTTLKFDYCQETWEDWDACFRDKDEEKIKQFSNEHSDRIMFFKWIQWQLYEQLKAVKLYANSKNVLVMGDMFFIVGRDSADVWNLRKYFRIDLVPGLPPEPMCPKGQRWGNQSMYNWKNIIDDDYELIKQRFKYNENFYDIVRLDTAASVFRMWCVKREAPQEDEGLNGFFYPEDCSVWEEQGEKLLEVIQQSTRMLICAENLAPLCGEYTPIIRKLGIPPICFHRWEKDWDITHNFILPQDYNPLTVLTLSNHDTSNFADWWENEAGRIDASRFSQLCHDYNLDYDEMKIQLFDNELSNDNKLRWKSSIDSMEGLLSKLHKNKDEVAELVHDYSNYSFEKEKLWNIMNLSGTMRESCDKEIMKAIIKTLKDSNAVWSISSIIDYLCLLGIIETDYNQYRFNTPGTVSGQNWTMTLPINIERLFHKDLCDEIKRVMEG